MLKTYIPIVLLAVSILSACTPTEKKQEETQEEAYEPAQADEESPVQLTDQQKKDGWKPLFDGKTMNGWRTFKNKESNSWEVKDGALHCKPFDDADKRADLVTTEQFENFELAFDWKISPAGNSGVMFRVTEAYDQPFFTGPEYQLMDDGGYPGEVQEINFSGGNYAMHAPTNKKLNPVGEWNSSRIVVNGTHVEHWLNGGKTADYELGSADWKKRKAAGKWKDVKDYGVPVKGHIDLQDHTLEVWFKNILIKPL